MLKQLELLKGLIRIAAVTLLTATGFLWMGATEASAQASFCVDDVDGANDVPGQGDVTNYCVDETNLPATFDTSFNFDILGLKGGNTGDGCTLYDTDSDGNINFAVCVSLKGTPFAIDAGPLLFTCNDSKDDRCGGDVPLSPVPGSLTACSVATLSTDPFPAGDDYPLDTEVSCTIDTRDVPPAGVLSNFCSFNSPNPNSNAPDCVANPSSAFVDIVKVSIPDDGTDFTFSLSGGPDPTMTTITGSGTKRLAVTAGTYSMTETVPTGWVVTSASCLDGATPLGSFDGIDTITGISLAPSSNPVCTFTNEKAGTIIVEKVTVPGGDPTSFTFTPSYNGGIPFQLADGQSNDSGDLASGTYSVVETVPLGWMLQSATCDDGSTIDSIDLATEETVTCTFSNVSVPTIGAAKTLASVSELGLDLFDVSFSFVIENLGSGGAPNVQLTEDLATTFAGASSFSVQAGPTVTGGLSTANSSFNGTSDIDLLDGSETLAAGQTATVTLTVRVDTGGNPGPYANQVAVTSAATPGGPAIASDLSDAGTDPDSDGDGNPSEAGEDDTTGFVLPPQVIGSAKQLTSTTQVGPTTYQFAFSLVVENLSATAPATNVQLTDDLDLTFPGATSITITAGPSATGGLSAASGSFNGTSDIDLLSGMETLAAAQTATVTFTAEVDLGVATGPFANQATVTSALTPAGSPVATDRSDSGSDPDPDGDGNPSESGEDDATTIPAVTPHVVGAAKALTSTTQVGPTTYQFAFSVGVENLGTVAAPNVQVTDDLNAAFPGVASITIVSGPSVTGALGTANGSYTGTGDIDLLAGNETLAVGQTATVIFTAEVDLGGAGGPFANQATVTSAATPGGAAIGSDVSDDGTDPDPDGDGNPSEAGEDDATSVVIAVQTIGAAKTLVSAPELTAGVFDVTFSLVVENLGAVPAANVQVTEDLAATFAGAASFSVQAGPTVSGGLSAANGSFNGTSDLDLLAGNETLTVGQIATITLTVRVDTGGNMGPYSNQVTATSAATPGGSPLSTDQSDTGSNPDPDGDGNPDETGENDATGFTLPPQAIGAAKELTSTTQVGPTTHRFAFSVVIENLSATEPATNVQVTDDLNATFPGVASITILTGPSVTGGLTTANAGFNGTSDIDLLVGNETLAVGQTATVTFVVEVDLGGAGGPFANQATVTSASTPGGAAIGSDVSDDGTDPDPDGDGNPSEAGEDDATTIPMTVAQVVGVAKMLTSAPEVSPDLFDVSFSIVVENLGSVPATNVQIPEDLATTFAGASSFSVTAGPTVTGGLSTANGSFNGTSDLDLLAGNETLGIGQTATIALTVQVDTGGNMGPYSNQVTATSSSTPGGAPLVTDLSDTGSDPDPDGDGNPDEAGENDATNFTLPPQIVGAAKNLTLSTQVGPTTYRFTFSLVVENLSTTEAATNVQLTDDLDAAFPGVASIAIVAGPTVTGGLSTVNSSFNGTSDINLLVGDEDLAIGQTATVTFTAEVDLGSAGGPFANQATVTSAATPGGTPISSDDSVPGSDPDPDGDGDPSEAGEDGATPITIAAQTVGAAKTLVSAPEVSTNVFDVTFALVVENLGTVPARNVQLTEDLAATFAGASSFSVTAGPTVSGGLSAANGSFNGTSDLDLLAGNETLGIGQTATIVLTVQVDTGGNMGPYSNQVTATSSATPGGPPLATDLSDTGSDPDPDGDGDPDEPGENDATGFTLPPQVIGVAKQLTTTAQVGPTAYQFAFSIVVENLSPAEVATNVQVTDDLAAAFPGVASITIVTGPTVTGGLSTANSSFNGSSDINLLAGNEDLAVGQTATVTFTVEVDLGGTSGPFANQASVTTAQTPGGMPIASDASVPGSDPDPDGDGNPSEAGEDGATTITIAAQILGAAKTLVSAPEVSTGVFDATFAVVVENLGTVPATNVQVTEDLATTFAGTSSFSVTSGPTVTGGLSAVNGSFNGTSNLDLLVGSESLAAGQTATVTFTVRVDTGGNVGPFSNQVTATSAVTPGGAPLSTDLSDTGSNPDPDGDGNPDEAGENDATGFTLPTQQIGAAKALTETTQVGPTTHEFSFSVALENLSPTEDATNVQLSDDLGAAFPGAASISIVDGPVAAGGLTAVNGSFDGTTDLTLLAGNETLAVGETATITFTVQVDLAGTSPPFTNQATVTTAATPGGAPIASDSSDAGTDPDPNGDGNPSEVGEDDATPIPITATSVGAAKALTGTTQVGPNVYRFRFSLVVENLGTSPAENVQLTDNLAVAFPGVAGIDVVSGPSVSGGLSAVNPNFDGTGDIKLLPGNETLAAGQSATVTFTVEIDLGEATGPFANQATVSTVADPGGSVISSDVSVPGTDPDPDGDGNPAGSGEDRTTAIPVEGQKLGLAKAVNSVRQVGTTIFELEYAFVLENLSAALRATNIQLVDDLAATFPGVDDITVLSVDAGSLTANPSFNGVSDTDLLAGTDTLAVGAQATVVLRVRVDVGEAAGVFGNRAVATTSTSQGGAALVSADSIPGTHPDPDGDGNVTAAQAAATETTLRPLQIGVAKRVSSISPVDPTTFDVEFSFELENLSDSVSATNVQIVDDLGLAFPGVSQIEIIAGPDAALVTPAANPAFDGVTNPNLLVGTDTLAPNTRDTVTFVVRIDTGGATGPYSNQARAISALAAGGTVLAEDLSDDGSSPDADGDGSAQGPGENDATVLSLVPPLVLVEKTADRSEASPGELVGYGVRVENLGTSSVLGMTLLDDLPGGFGLVEETVVMTRAGEDGQVLTPDDSVEMMGVLGVDPVMFGPFDLAVGESIEISYMTRISSGVTRGETFNTVTPELNGFAIGNEATSVVRVSGDPIFERTTLIGKVFHDRDADGWQDDAGATGIALSGGPFGDGYEVPDLAGRLRETDPLEEHTKTVRLPVGDSDADATVTLTTHEGTVLDIDTSGRLTERNRGDMAAGRTGQQLQVTRRSVVSDGQQQLVIEMTNHGVGEEGIPGVRLATVGGLTIETDPFGRFHLADVDVERFERGVNFILKVDPVTLPEGAIFTTENPRVIRLTQALMTKFDFGVKLPEPETVRSASAGDDALAHGGVIWATEDPLVRDPRLNVLALDEVVVNDDGVVEPVRFAMYSNYGAFITGWELRIYDGRDTDLVRPIETLTGDRVRFDQPVVWSAGGLSFEPGSELAYVLSVTDTEGRLDETRPRRLAVVREKLARGPAADVSGGPADAAGVDDADVGDEEDETLAVYGQSNLARQQIPVTGGRVRVHGADVSTAYEVMVDGEAVPLTDEGTFVVEAHLPVGEHEILVEVAGDAGERWTRRVTVDVERDYLFLVGMANLTVGQNDVNGAIEPLSADDHFDGDVFSDGRVAMYAKGKIQGRYLVTAQLDTTEDELKNLDDRIGQEDPRRLFRQLDPDRYYPVYGDDSTTTTDVDSQGSFYVRVDVDKSQALWGNFNSGLIDTEFLQYNRSLYGAKGRYESTATTAFGDARAAVTGFTSEAQSALGHNTFLATGGSLYYLRHTRIVEGSEKVRVEVRRRDTEEIVEREVLINGRDYEIDSIQGRIILRRPLSQVVNGRSSAIIRSRPLEGDDVLLLVDYEYVPDGFVADERTYGGRGKVWVGDHVGIGATGVADERDDVDYELRGFDATVRAGQGTYLKAEYAESQARQTDSSFFSVDGGLNFASQNLTGQGPAIAGEAVAVEGRVNLAELSETWSGDVRAWYKTRDAGFSIGRLDEGIATEDRGVELDWQPGSVVAMQAGYVALEKEGVSQQTVARVQADVQVTELLSAGVELRNEQRDDLRRDVSGEATLVGVRVGYDLTPETTVYGSAQTVTGSEGILNADTEGNDNDLTAVGINTRVSKELALALEVSAGDRGEAVSAGIDYAAAKGTHLSLSGGVGAGATSELGANYAVAEGHELYGTYTVNPDRTEGPMNTFTVGQRRDFGNSLAIFTEEQFGKGDELASAAHVFGVDFGGDGGWLVSSSLQLGNVESLDGKRDRVAATVGASLDREAVDFSTRFELRRDDGPSVETRQYLTTNALTWKASESQRWLAKLNLSWTDDLLGGGELARFVELDLGHAVRPTRSDRLNVLTKYSFLYDLTSVGQLVARPDQRSHIVSAEALYDLNHRWELGGKVALKLGELRPRRETGAWIENGLTLGTARARYHFVRNWDALAEYRRLASVGGEDVRHGALFAVYRHLLNQLKVGVGYSFTDFNDDLKDEQYTHRGWFFDIVWKQ